MNVSSSPSPARPTRFLLASVPLAGHVHPAVPIAQELVARGHEVRWLTGAEYRELVESTGASFEPLVDSYDPADGMSIFDRFPERRGLSGLAGIKFDIKHLFLDQIPGQVADLQRALDSFAADLIVADMGFMGVPVQHELGGAPWATIGITPLAIPSRDLPPFGPGLPPIRNRRDRMRAAAMSFGQRAVMRDVEAHHALVRSTLGLSAPSKTIFEMASPYLVLQSGTEAFDYPRSDLPSHVHYVGPLISSGRPSDVQTDWTALAAGRPIVVVTQGTLANEDATLIEPALQGLATEDVYVVAVGPAPTSLPDNARHLAYLPYEEILPLASAMVTNGGYGGVQIALAHGVPLAVAGTTEDKPEVAARVAWSGAGINLRTAAPTADAVRAAVRRLLSDESLRAGARRIADDYARHDAAQTAADLLESTASVLRGQAGAQRAGRSVTLPGRTT